MESFWARWTELYGPLMYLAAKQVTTPRSILPGDVVSVLDHKSLKPQYYIALVKQIYPSSDGIVRKALISYKSFRVGEKCYDKGASETQIVRSVRMLALLPVDR